MFVEDMWYIRFPVKVSGVRENIFKIKTKSGSKHDTVDTNLFHWNKNIIVA